ncbi:tyrosine-protein kinase Fer isoform X6 [Strix aluco]|uniref:tyrosine-protein kinase Fer isoform X6 n=1 Tax=Strix aluco TaxID=111821 RepID=UPI003DA4F901
MGFGGDLKYSHDALLKLQDWELRLLETVKKFMVMRVKSDKEYASTLQNLCNQVDKESACQLDYISNVSKSWLLVVQQTEQLSKIMKTHAEDLNSGPLHRLTMMIKDKQQVKKSYVGVHQQIEAEMYKVTKTELEKLKSSYRQLIKEVNSAKEKYKEAVAKDSVPSGKPSPSQCLTLLSGAERDNYSLGHTILSLPLGLCIAELPVNLCSTFTSCQHEKNASHTKEWLRNFSVLPDFEM